MANVHELTTTVKLTCEACDVTVGDAVVLTSPTAERTLTMCRSCLEGCTLRQVARSVLGVEILRRVARPGQAVWNGRSSSYLLDGFFPPYGR